MEGKLNFIKNLGFGEILKFMETQKFGTKKLNSKCNAWLLDVCARQLKSGKTPRENLTMYVPRIHCFYRLLDYETYTSIKASGLSIFQCNLCDCNKSGHRIKLPAIHNSNYVCEVCYEAIHVNCMRYAENIYNKNIEAFFYIHELDLVHDVFQLICRLVF